MSGFQTDMLEGFARKLHADHVGTWRATGAYGALETGVVLVKAPQAPDRLVTLSAYGISDAPLLSDSEIGLQVRSRWNGQDPRGAYDLDDASFDVLQDYSGTLATGVKVVLCRRINGPTPLGQDGNGRWSVVSNYAVMVHRPSANRT